MTLVFLLCTLVFISPVVHSVRPTVLWHGMGDVCCNPLSMGYIQSLIEKTVPGSYVYSVEVGSSEFEDEFRGFIGDANEEVDEVCKTLKADPKLAGGFNAVGFSQGGQFLRAYVERCNDPPVYNLITMGGQHQGVADVPACTSINETICSIIETLLADGAYTSLAQSLVIQAQYFHDPMAPIEYLKYNKFIVDINNDAKSNPLYKKNLISLNNLVLVMFSEDITVVPKESSWFGFYADNNPNVIVPYNETSLYIQDRIGLKTLDARGALKFDTCPGGHMHIPQQWFVDHVIKAYLTN